MIKRSRIKMSITLLMVLIVNTLFTPPLSANTDVTIYGQFLPSGPNYTQADTKAILRVYAGPNEVLPANRVEWRDPQGVQVYCGSPGPGCTIYNEYAANGNLIASRHELYISGRQRPSGTYTAIVTYCRGYNCSGGWGEAFRAAFYIGAASVTYTLSGNAGIAGASLRYVDGATKTATADGTGNYAITVPSDWSGTVTPFKPGYFFSPASRTYTNVLADQPAQNYTPWAIASQVYLPLAMR